MTTTETKVRFPNSSVIIEVCGQKSGKWSNMSRFRTRPVKHDVIQQKGESNESKSA